MKSPDPCHRCRAWRRLQPGDLGHAPGEDRGECHRHAPFPISTGEVLGLSRWPLKLADDFCLDWVPYPHGHAPEDLP